ncbi:MFS transporter [Streptomyces cellulosae]
MPDGSITLFALLGRRLHIRVLVLIGAVMSAAAVWLFVLTGATDSLALFFLASAVAGAAYAFDFAGGLTVLSRCAPAPHRAGRVSGAYLDGYAAQGIGAPALGAVVTAHGLMSELVTGAAVAGGFFVLVAVVGLAVLTPLHRADREAARRRTAAGTGPGGVGPEEHRAPNGEAPSALPPGEWRTAHRIATCHPFISPVRRAGATD